jgi:hypothetical protein
MTGTPAFFVDGIPVFGTAPLTQIIDEELALQTHRTRAGRRAGDRGVRQAHERGGARRCSDSPTWIDGRVPAGQPLYDRMVTEP